MAGITVPTLPIVKFIIMHPIGVDLIFFSRIQGYFAVVIGVIFKLAQDYRFLTLLVLLVFVCCNQFR